MPTRSKYMIVQLRICDIRSSEKALWRKVLEICATSIDYDSGFEASRTFFTIVQYKIRCWMFFRG